MTFRYSQVLWPIFHKEWKTTKDQKAIEKTFHQGFLESQNRDQHLEEFRNIKVCLANVNH